MPMARTADTNRRKTASRRRVIQSIREKYEPKVARTANQKLKGSGVGIFSFSRGNFFFPEPKRKRSRAAFSNSWNSNLAMFGSKKTRAVLSLLTFLSRPKDTDAAAPQVNVRRKMRFAYLCRACSMGKKRIFLLQHLRITSITES